jgi:ABC-type thiamine transport system substrate-binding protein
MIHYYKAVKAVNGILIILWHNTFLGTDKLYTGWAELYRQFLQTISPAEV